MAPRDGSTEERAIDAVLFDFGGVIIGSPFAAIGARRGGGGPRSGPSARGHDGRLRGRRAVFLDDAPGNVAGARAAGLHAILVADPADALAELSVLLAG